MKRTPRGFLTRNDLLYIHKETKLDFFKQSRGFASLHSFILSPLLVLLRRLNARFFFPLFNIDINIQDGERNEY